MVLALRIVVWWSASCPCPPRKPNNSLLPRDACMFHGTCEWGGLISGRTNAFPHARWTIGSEDRPSFFSSSCWGYASGSAIVIWPLCSLVSLAGIFTSACALGIYSHLPAPYWMLAGAAFVGLVNLMCLQICVGLHFLLWPINPFMCGQAFLYTIALAIKVKCSATDFHISRMPAVRSDIQSHCCVVVVIRFVGGKGSGHGSPCKCFFACARTSAWQDRRVLFNCAPGFVMIGASCGLHYLDIAFPSFLIQVNHIDPHGGSLVLLCDWGAILLAGMVVAGRASGWHVAVGFLTLAFTQAKKLSERSNPKSAKRNRF